MAFADPSSGFFSPNTPSAGPVDIPTARMQSLPGLDNINSPRAQPFEMIRPIRYEPDKTAGVAIAGAAEIIKNSVEGMDNAFKATAAKEVRTEIGNLFNKQIQAGLDTKQELLAEQSEKQNYMDEAPSGLQQGLSRLATMQKAARSGAFSDSHLQAQAGEILTGLKNRYPGYEYVISDTAERLFGVSPEKHRASLQRDVDAIRKAQMDKVDYWTKEFFKESGILGQGWQNRPIQENMEIIRKHRSNVAYDESEKLRIAAETRSGIAPEQRVGNHYSWWTAKNGADMFNTMFKELEKGPSGFTLQKLQNGEVTPEQTKTAIYALKRLQEEYYRTSQQRATIDSIDPTNPSLTVFSVLNNAGKGDEIEKTLKRNDPFQKMIDALGGNNWAVAGQETRDLKSMTDAREVQIMTNNKDLHDWSIILPKLGPAGSAIFNQDTTMQRKLVTAVDNVFERRNAMPGSPFSHTLDNYGSQHQAEYSKKPSADAFNNMLNKKIAYLTIEGADKTYQEGHFRDVYLDPRSTYLVDAVKAGSGGINTAVDTYNRFISTDITKKVSSMPEDIRQGYAGWAKTNFSRIAPSLSDAVRGTVTSNPYFEVKFDEATSTYVTQPTKAGKAKPLEYGLAIRMSLGGATTPLNRLNSTLQLLKPIVEANGGNFNEYLKTLNLLPPESMEKGVNKTSFKDAAVQQTNSTVVDPDGHEPIRSLIRRGENRGSYKGMNADPSLDVETMTVGAILEHGKKITPTLKEGQSTAAGAYQIKHSTLKMLVDKGAIGLDDVFDKNTQDRAGSALLKLRGWDDYKSGKLPKSKFLDNISKEWAALPRSTGGGSWDGVNGNKSNVKISEIMDLL